MSDVGESLFGGHARLTPIPHDADPPNRPRRGPVVPADRVLEIAAALSDGAARIHEQLSDLGQDRREALLGALTEQLNRMVGLWASLLLDVVDPEAPAPVSPDRLAVLPDPGQGRDLPASARPEPPDTSPYRRRTPQPPVEAVDSDRPPMTRDELTGVLNRQAGVSALNREIARCRQSGAGFILGYLNVDGLRSVNESLGPRAGDELLRKVTAAMRATLRSYDVISRLGGDEFLFSLPGADMATAEQRYKEFAVILGEDAPGATASVGFAELQEDDTLDDLIARADGAFVQSRRRRRRSR